MASLTIGTFPGIEVPPTFYSVVREWHDFLRMTLVSRKGVDVRRKFMNGKRSRTVFRWSVWVMAAASCGGAVAQSGTVQPLAEVKVGATSGRAIPKNFLGLSHEWRDAQTITGDANTGVNMIYRRLLENLAMLGAGPLTIRVGGNSADHTQVATEETVKPFVEASKALGLHYITEREPGCERSEACGGAGEDFREVHAGGDRWTPLRLAMSLTIFSRTGCGRSPIRTRITFRTSRSGEMALCPCFRWA